MGEDTRRFPHGSTRKSGVPGYALRRSANGELSVQHPIRECILDAYSRLDGASETVIGHHQAAGYTARRLGPFSRDMHGSACTARR